MNDKQIEAIEHIAWEVCSELDWSRVEDTMNHLQWYWFDDIERTPNAGTLMRQAISYSKNALELSLAKKGAGISMGSGGIMVKASWEGDIPFLKVVFELSSADNYE